MHLQRCFSPGPKEEGEGKHHTYYHMKDILFLKHEPLLEKFREMRAYEKKVKKSVSKKNKDLAERLYPKFIDSLRDSDDCLTMVHLFVVLHAIERENIQVERIHNCRGLSLEWQAYISRTHKLRKVFISVKGIYYQAEVEGQNVTWLTPQALQQVMPQDADYKIMLTFLEFYEVYLYALTRYVDAKDQTKGANVEESELRLAQLQTKGWPFTPLLPTSTAMPKHYRPTGKKKKGNAARYIIRSQAQSLRFQVSIDSKFWHVYM
ncbi:hypothetical protein L6452_18636 [Arctium lappa]|uniref:Uncharacterized protein n=1 Tax=Arctium lappa TaxID=4217 RepID=A0ACB9C717_ARCLA|nr:hypothetical protein L6452_18636 [Arctium lappa]